MIAEQFMLKYPFPKDGHIKNEEYIKTFQKTDDENLKNLIWDKMVKLNARLIGTVYKRHKYFKFMSEEELMSIYATAVHATLRNFNEDYFPTKTGVANHIITNMRSGVGKYVHQEQNLISIPTNIKKGKLHLGIDTNFQHVDSDTYSDFLGDPNLVDLDNKMFCEDIVSEYKKVYHSPIQLENLDYFLRSLEHSADENVLMHGNKHRKEQIRMKIKQGRQQMQHFSRNYRKHL